MHESRSVERLSPFLAPSVSAREERRGSSRGSSLGIGAAKIPRSSDDSTRPHALGRERTEGMDARPDLTSSAPDDVLLTASQLARRFSVSRNWVYQAVEDGRLPYRRLGQDGPIRFVSAEIDEWLETQRRGWTPGRSRRRAA
jgi:excisionase family DNA binding protein